ncbi:hypothetical protein M440DRAFT_1404721 [Trichoderma longibrachiatum ATCC 18648]|uniref:Uncharacterized protein n=1 Tax=Trichoderma longibrachiatum ATCC 18648 TaxID=983965 RepID=A0A2T4BUJ9_TRILO|nr:hypothetical protein M440DRAFT_1404721 [Trichoderma longibrachiatum ATCC 18648]
MEIHGHDAVLSRMIPGHRPQLHVPGFFCSDGTVDALQIRGRSTSNSKIGLGSNV